MTEDRLPALLASDLAALADDNRRDPVAVDDLLRRTGAYRDDRPSLEARLAATLDARRRELALMPLALSQVFASRVGRAAAGAVAVLCAAATVLAACHPGVAPLAGGIARLDAAAWGAFVATFVLASHVLAAALAARAFEQRMGAAIATGTGDPAELDQLGHGPLERAQRLVHRADGYAVALGVAGATALTMLVGVRLVGRGAFASSARGWASSGGIGERLVAHNAALLAAAFVLAMAWAAILGRACVRERRGGQRSRWLRRLGHGPALGVALALGLAARFGGARELHVAVRSHALTGSGPRLALIAIGTAAAILATTWATLWWRRREQARIGDDEASLEG